MSEIDSVPKAESSLSPKKLLSSKKSTKIKKLKGKKKLTDISNQVTLEFQIEDFEQESESFIPQIYRPDNVITIDNVPLLDQSHFRFLINPNSEIVNNYNSYKHKNFKNISWKDIELVYFYCHENYTCPICLESKLCCPVISKCGHVFCYPCIISLYNYYKDLNDIKNIPCCPLCKGIIDMNSDDDYFKICQKIENINYNIDMKIKFNLILRDKKSPTLFNLVYDPLLTNWENSFRYKMRDIPEKDSKEFSFSRIFFANEKIMNNILNQYKTDLNDLKTEFFSTSDNLKKISINQCIDKIDSLINSCKYEKKSKEDNQKNKDNSVKTYKKNIKENFFSEESDDLKVDIDYKKYSLFYQEEKGDIYYLDPLIMEILLYEYGDYNSLPTELEGNIIDISMIQVNSEFKSKYKYLNHLRIGSIIYFIEIDIKDLISSSTEKKFGEKLSERNKLRNLFKNQEKRYELFLLKKNSKSSEEENSTKDDSKKSLEQNIGSLFFRDDEELINERKETTNNYNIESKKENKLTLLFLEKEEEDKEVKEEKKNILNEPNKILEKGGKNKKKNKKGGKKGKKKNIKETVFNSENGENFSEKDC